MQKWGRSVVVDARLAAVVIVTTGSSACWPPSYLLFSFFRFRFSLSVNFAFFCVSFLPLSFFPLSPIFYLLSHDVIRL